MMEKLLIKMPLFKWRVTKGYNNSPFKYKPAQYLGGVYLGGVYLGGVYFPQKGMVELAHLMGGGGPCLHFWFKSSNFLGAGLISDRNS